MHWLLRAFALCVAHVLSQLLLVLLVRPSGGLDERYFEMEPHSVSKHSVARVLAEHVNHSANASTVLHVAQALRVDGQASAFQLLKLVTRMLFRPDAYRVRDRVGQGAYGVVHEAEQAHVPGLLAVKLSPVTRTVLVDMMSEIAILRAFHDDGTVCTMYDFGVDHENYWLVMRRYRCSLKQWRERLQAAIDESGATLTSLLPLFWAVFTMCVEAVQHLQASNVLHFDLKADNVLLEPISDSVTDAEMFGIPPAGEAPPFRVCITDFGESYMFGACARVCVRDAVCVCVCMYVCV